jgi:hypothetical protein
MVESKPQPIPRAWSARESLKQAKKRKKRVQWKPAFIGLSSTDTPACSFY